MALLTFIFRFLNSPDQHLLIEVFEAYRLAFAVVTGDGITGHDVVLYCPESFQSSAGVNINRR